MRKLDTAKISYTVHTYEPDGDVDGVHVAGKLGLAPALVYKTLVTKGKSGKYFVFVVPVEGTLDLKKAAKSVGEKSVAMLAVKDLLPTTGYIRGGCSPVGMKKQFVTVVDASAEDLETVYVSGGKIGLQLGVSPKKLVEMLKGKFEEILMDSAS